MDKRWFMGFVEGEGCFSLGFRVSKTAMYGIQPMAEFIVSQDDHECIEKMIDFLRQEINISDKIYRGNKSRKNGNISYEFRLIRKSDVKKLADWLSNEKFETKKQYDFERWKKGVELMNRPRGWRVPYSPEELMKFAELAVSISRVGKGSIRKYTPAIIIKLINSAKLKKRVN